MLKLPYMIMLLVIGFVPTTAKALSWEDLWLTPHQLASRQMENEDYQAMTENKDRHWQGVGHYQLGDHAAAAERFAEDESLDSRYNLGTTLTQSGEYDKAIELFDSVLEEQPTHEKALKNRDIAKQLKELQQQQQQDSQEGDSDQDQENQDQQDSSDESQSQDSQSQDSDASKDDQDNQSQSQESQQNEEESEKEQKQRAEQEKQEEQEEQNGDDEESAQQQALQETEMPLSEDQQATEQWLRKIPDDPAGLLRRKLRRNHAAEYPNVVNSDSPW